ncbi:MAG: HU family DNA-binding protein [Thiovulaceae bacterium]|nr:HU family DNA-binding protein [Sulfurimonadaceae bacterium]
MNEKIHYDDFIEEIATKSGYDNDTVREYLGVMFETIVTESTKGNSVKIRNFGSFQPRWYKAKRGINPQTGQPLDILPHYHIHFASSKVLDSALNKELSKPSSSKLILTSLVVLLIIVFIYFFNTSTNEPEKAKIVEPVKQTQKIVTTIDKPIEPVVKKEIEEQVVEKVIEEQVVEKEVEQIIQKPVALYPGNHRVIKNETLSAIGLKIYGNKGYWPLLFSANNSEISNPDLILKGSYLVVPDKTKSKQLYVSYMDVHNAYMERDFMSKSFWVLCEGSNFLGKNFQMYLKEKLIPAEYAIIDKCSP